MEIIAAVNEDTLTNSLRRVAKANTYNTVLHVELQRTRVLSRYFFPIVQTENDLKVQLLHLWVSYPNAKLLPHRRPKHNNEGERFLHEKIPGIALATYQR